ECLLEIGGRCSSQEGCAGAGARNPSGNVRATQRLYQRPVGRQERYEVRVVGRLPMTGSLARCRYRAGIMPLQIQNSEISRKICFEIVGGNRDRTIEGERCG